MGTVMELDENVTGKDYQTSIEEGISEAQKVDEFGTDPRDSSKILADFCENRTDLGLNLGRLWPKLERLRAKTGPTLAKTGPTLGKNWADFGQNGTDLGKNWAAFCLNWTYFGQKLARLLLKLVRFGEKLARLCAKIGLAYAISGAPKLKTVSSDEQMPSVVFCP